MKYTDNEMSILLLCSHIGLGSESDIKPLTLGEWNRFYDSLVKYNTEPKIIFDDILDLCDALKNMGYDDAFAIRLKKLADRGAALSFELQEYEKKGISVITEISKGYPIMLRHELRNKKPPVLFYSGDITLAGKVGIGIVGSRDVSQDGFDFTREIVLKALSENMIIYSGGAKGVDITSETVALNSGGAVVSYLADSLLTKIKRTDMAEKVAKGKMLLISDQKPDVGFSVGRAMNRNKYIYGSAYGTFVVESDYNKGGTWTGAIEAIKNGWGNVFVRDNQTKGNRMLIENGGVAYYLSEDKLFNIIKQVKDNKEVRDIVNCANRLTVRGKDRKANGYEEYEQLSLF